ncbi:GNAT family N-acetyltransferase [Robertkochia aurantiaca]|uniref:GNAT family N-acetyltransferase n=1 Tax=Robertkochia aurantiaca TaxID=2873700 RepID=UPI001CC9FD29|nr:GNAT family N-acetyltransferase [Robertkochia sp. 3YJGBD-33]
MTIREIRPEDDPLLARAIRDVLIEMNVPKKGTAYEDAALDQMYETYQSPKSVYYVVSDESGSIYGGAGIAPLMNYEGNVCELQKMYFLPQVRGKGIGRKMIETCLQAAREFGFDQCYIETMPNMKTAQQLYLNNGFHYIDQPMGDTGHSSCPVWLLKDL